MINEYLIIVVRGMTLEI